jgi:hypothetical protein
MSKSGRLLKSKSDRLLNFVVCLSLTDPFYNGMISYIDTPVSTRSQ